MQGPPLPLAPVCLLQQFTAASWVITRAEVLLKMHVETHFSGRFINAWEENSQIVRWEWRREECVA